ncbi:MAG: hypothetical protein ACQRW7_12905 [Caulobacterales bacterium]|uniref:hypothetical protein n=1 Tax=Glycocaulis sp. TaxID=1969725 RepID=UPI003FA14330
MADFSACNDRPGRQINVGALLIAVVMFGACLALAHASGMLGSDTEGLFLADTAQASTER